MGIFNPNGVFFANSPKMSLRAEKRWLGYYEPKLGLTQLRPVFEFSREPEPEFDV